MKKKAGIHEDEDLTVVNAEKNPTSVVGLMREIFPQEKNQNRFPKKRRVRTNLKTINALLGHE